MDVEARMVPIRHLGLAPNTDLPELTLRTTGINDRMQSVCIQPSCQNRALHLVG